MPYAKGRVLALACETGYGTQMVAKAKKKQIAEILGVDIDTETIDYAKKNYYHPLLSFQTGDALSPNLKSQIGTFDTVISFETIEHVPDDKEFLNKVYTLLQPGGTLVLSTPYGQGRGKPCGSPFHYHQLTESEFIALFNEKSFDFQHVQFFYQQGVMIEMPKRPEVHYPIGIAVCKKGTNSE